MSEATVAYASDLSILGGNGGQGAAWSTGAGGKGGDAKLTATNVTVTGQLNITSGKRETTLNATNGAGGAAELHVSGTLIANTITATKQDGPLSVDIATLGVSAATTITANGTDAGEFVITTVNVAAGQTLTIDDTNGALTINNVTGGGTIVLLDGANAIMPIHTVTYQPNGGVGGAFDVPVHWGTPHAVAANTFTRPGYNFTGWNTALNGNGTSFAVGDSIAITADIDLYAQWTPPASTPDPGSTTDPDGTDDPGPSTVLVTDVTLSQSTLSLSTGGTAKLSPIVTPTNATNKSVTWKSSDESVATVDKDGNVTAVGAGTCTITVTTASGGKTAICTVTVAAPFVPEPTEIEIDLSGLGLEDGVLKLSPGDEVDLTITADPAGTTFSAAGLPDGLTLTPDGRLFGEVPEVGTYTVTITATAPDGTEISETFVIEVKDDGTVTVTTSSGGGCSAGAMGLFVLLAVGMVVKRRR